MEYNITYGDIADGLEVVSLEMAKKNSKIETSDENDVLQLFLDAAIEDAENYTGIVISKREVTLSFSEWAKKYVLPISPISSIVSVSYTPPTGADVDLTTDDYTFFNSSGLPKLQINLDSFPSVKNSEPLPIKIVLNAGFEEAEIPKAIKSAILLRFSHKELYREDTPVPTSMDRTFYSALRPFKQW